METIKNPHQAQYHFILPESDKPLKEPTIKLTQEQIDFFKTNGFLSIDRLTDDNEVAHIRDQYDQVNISLVYLHRFFFLCFFFVQWFAAKVGREHGNFFDLLSEDADDREAVAPQLLWPSIYGKNMTGFDLYNTQMYANAYEISKTLLGDDTTFKGV